MKEHVNIILEKQELQYLHDVLSTCQDEGPEGEGWASDKLESILTKLRFVLIGDNTFYCQWFKDDGFMCEKQCILCSRLKL